MSNSHRSRTSACSTLNQLYRASSLLGLLALTTLIVACGDVEKGVNVPPIANAGPDQTRLIGDTVQLDGTASTDADGSNISYSWSFVSLPASSAAVLSDSTSPMPTFVIDLAGEHVIELIVSDGEFDSQPSTVTVSVTNSRPVANAGTDQTLAAGSLATLDGSGSDDVDGDPIAYRWTISATPANSMAALDSSVIESPSFVLDQAGNYVVELVVNDGFQDSDADEVVISSTNSKPVADAGIDQIVEVGELVILDGGASFDADNDPLTYFWSILSDTGGSMAGLFDSDQQVASFTPDVEGLFVLQLIVNDGYADSDADTSTTTVNAAPVGTIDSDGDGLTDAAEVALGTDPNNPDTDNDGLSDGDEVNAYITDPLDDDSDNDQLLDGEEIDTYGTNPNNPDTDNDGANDFDEVGAGTDPNDPLDFPVAGVPPDPSTFAPPLIAGEISTVKSATEFLYLSSPRIQTGVNPDNIKAQTAVLIRGKVLVRGGGPLSGVKVTILNHPEYGETISRADGMFDLVVNGGEKLVVDYELAGYAPAQRHVQSKWNSWVWADDVSLVPLDPIATVIDLSLPAPFQIARASVQTDSSGSRQATLLFPANTTAQMILPDGSTQPLTTITVRATEYTVGPDGPAAMPAPLPPTNGYTYAAELSIDEALAAGATEVQFNQEVFFYVENFLGFPAGTVVPVGFYSETKGIWEPSKDGLVIDIVSETDGAADIDFDGDGLADDVAMLESEIGLSLAEREQLATTYAPGDSLWRAATTHFTPIDCNLATRVPTDLWPDGKPRVRPRKDKDATPEDDPCEQAGSIIECQSRVLRESVPLAGTSMALNYRSDRASDVVEFDVDITSDDNAYLNMAGITVVFDVAGRRETRTYTPQLNLTDTFSWDGLDAYGRKAPGAVPATVSIFYDWPITYLLNSRGNDGSDSSSSSFGAPVTGSSSFVIRPDNNARAGRVINLGLFGSFDAREQGTGGWTADVHHFYDPVSSSLSMGTGEESGGSRVDQLSVRLAYSGGNSRSLGAIDSTQDGTFYVASRCTSSCTQLGITAVYSEAEAQRQGVARRTFTLANNERWTILDLDVAEDGNIWFVGYQGAFGDNVNQLGYMTPAGDITMLIENFAAKPSGLVLDSMGGAYVALELANQILYFSPQVLKSGSVVVEDGVVLEPFISRPTRMSMDKAGRLYIGSIRLNTNSTTRVVRLDPDGTLTTVAGGGSSTENGIEATLYSLNGASDVYADEYGGFYLAEADAIQYVDPSGVTRTIAGGNRNCCGDNAPDFDAPYGQNADDVYLLPEAVSVGPDGQLYATMSVNGTDALVKLAPKLPEFTAREIVIANTDGAQLFHFSSSGRHLRTSDANTYETELTFDYDVDGFLSSITDDDGQVVTFQRSAAQLTSITSPNGVLSSVETNADGWMTRMTDPGGNFWQFGYDIAAGRMTSMIDRNGGEYQYAYDADGYFVSELGPDNSLIQLSRTEDGEAGWFEVLLTDRNNLTTTYRREFTANRELLFTNTYPEGGVTTIAIEPNGDLIRTFPTGTEMQVRRLADNRFGMRTPLSSGRIQTPSGRRVNFESTRSEAYSGFNDPDNLTTITSTWSMGSQSITTVFDRTQRTLTTAGGSGLGDVVNFSSDWKMDSVTRAGLLPQSFTRDAQGRPSTTSMGSESLSLTYDSFGEIATVTDAAGRVVRYASDAAGNLASITMPNDEVVTLGYDANGNMTSVSPPSGDAHLLGYNNVNLPAWYEDPNGNRLTMSYDQGRRLISTQYANGIELTNVFDNVGLIDTVSYGDAQLVFTHQSGTDLLDSLVRSVTGGGSQSLAYSWDGHLQTGAVMSGSANGTFVYDYDSSMRLNSIQLDGGIVVADSYNSDGLLDSHGPFALSRYPQTNLAQSWTDADAGLSFEYDGLGRVTRRWNEANGIVVFDMTLAYNNIGQIVSRSETVVGTTTEYVYTYGTNGELATVTIDGALAEEYAYDANTNRTNANGVAASYDASDRISTLGATAYDWDANGYLIARGGDSFDYSVRGELVSATIGGVTIDYDYDGLGRVVSRTENSETTQYLYGSPAALHLLTHSRAPDGTLTTYFYDEAGLLHAFERGGQMYYVAVDQVGSPKVIYDASGVVLREIRHNAWGEVLADSNPALELAIGFAGGIEDQSTGLVRFMLRDYDPRSGRWTARDPARFDGGQNLYMYANSDPIQFRDPTGLVCVGASAYAVLGGGLTGCYENGKWSICSEVGAGGGGGLTLNPFGKVARTERYAKVGASAAFGPLLGADISLKYTDCGKMMPTAEGEAGCNIAFVKCNGDLTTLGDVEKGDGLFKYKAGVTATIGACARF